jgi:DNA (cytosine-5)-methyltransferase 1
LNYVEKIKVIELFAGVGGFRLGLERASDRYEVVWSNQWEPSTKVQHASDIYIRRFGHENHHNGDISKVPTSEIPDHDLLVGGFPCQDYSVARTLNHAKGLAGKKGVLWWEIYRIVETKQPKYLFLENVDRLLKSPGKQRGRDFAIMLASLSDLGYAVEWRVINAAEYGMPQRRRRVFIMAYHQSTPEYKGLSSRGEKRSWLDEFGILARTFPVKQLDAARYFNLTGGLDEISESFNRPFKMQMDLFSLEGKFDHRDLSSPFENTGLTIDRQVTTAKTAADYDGPKINLGDIILTNGDVPTAYYLTSDSLDRWAYLKGSKNEKRQHKASGFEYEYVEGSMVFPDPLDKPSRTIITGEGGATPSRFKHVIQTQDGKLRRLTPVELERLNMFPDNHTQGVSDVRRAFFMGNALVVGIVEAVGRTLERAICPTSADFWTK